jgi:hypothetical protein
VRTAPLIGRHFHGMSAAYDAGEAAQHVYATKYFDRALHCGCDSVLVTYVDGFGDDAPVRELGMKMLDCFEALVGLEGFVP